jgi:branched-chain amino acid transport system permease protein
MLELVTVSMLNGVVYGLLLFMLSSGLTLIFSMMGVLNFAHASLFMLGAYLSFQFGRWVGFWPALVVAPLACALVGAAIERYGLRRVHASGHVAEILFTFGLAYVIEEIVTMIWGRNAVANNVPAVIDFPLFTVFGSTFPAYKGLMMAISVAMFVFLYVALKKTRIGLVIQAALTHPRMVSALGHDVPGVFVLVFAVARARGLRRRDRRLHAAHPTRSRDRAGRVRRRGRRGWVRCRRLIASMLIGILQTFAVAVDYSRSTLRASALRLARSPFHECSAQAGDRRADRPYLLLVLMLIVRPRGLLGAAWLP